MKYNTDPLINVNKNSCNVFRYDKNAINILIKYIV